SRPGSPELRTSGGSDRAKSDRADRAVGGAEGLRDAAGAGREDRGEDRHRRLLRRGRAEIEADRGVEAGVVDAAGVEFRAAPGSGAAGSHRPDVPGGRGERDLEQIGVVAVVVTEVADDGARVDLGRGEV